MDENRTRTNTIQLRRRAERQYKRLLNNLFVQVEKKIIGLTDPDDIIRTLKQIADMPKFDQLCIEAARQMATMLAVGQKATWRTAAAASSQGRAIYKALLDETTNTVLGNSIQDIVMENAKLIRTVPRDMAKRFTTLAQKRWTEGLRPYEITREMNAQAKHLKEYEARRIARTESAKASTALIQARAESLNLDFYIWRTARDGERVRKSHQIMENVICRWSDAPNPESIAGETKNYGNYPPGGIFNCRCIALPVLDLSDIRFPCKAHMNGNIHNIGSIIKFRELFSL